MLKWLKYIALSLIVNGFFLSAIQAEKPVVIKPIKPIGVSIMTLTKPMVKPLKKQVKALKKPKLVKPKLEKIVTKKQAKKRIKLAEKVVKKKKSKVKEVIKKAKEKPKKVVRKEVKATKSVNHNKGKDVSTILHKANYRKQTPIIYPKRALKRKQEGKVLLKVQISRNGLPLEIEIKQSSGFSLLDNAAIKTVKTWAFEPQKKGSVAIKSWALVPVKFEIKKG